MWILEPIKKGEARRPEPFFSSNRSPLLPSPSFSGSGHLHAFSVCPFRDFRVRSLHQQNLSRVTACFPKSRRRQNLLLQHYPLYHLVIENSLSFSGYRFNSFW